MQIKIVFHFSGKIFKGRILSVCWDKEKRVYFYTVVRSINWESFSRGNLALPTKMHIPAT